MKPQRLELLPGLRWHGHLTVLARHGDGWLVDWDAIDPKASPQARHVMDRAVLTTKQVHDWTGMEPAAKDDP